MVSPLYLVINKIQLQSDFSADLFSENDLFMKLSYNNIVQRTNTKWDSVSCEWNNLIVFPLRDAATASDETNTLQLTISIYDEDKWSADNMLYTSKLDIDLSKNIHIIDGVQLHYSTCVILCVNEHNKNVERMTQLQNTISTINTLSYI